MKKNIIIIFSIVLIIVSMSFLFVFFNPFIKINVSIDELEINVFDSFEIPNAKASIFGKELKYNVSNNINNNVVGKYNIEYRTSFLKTNKVYNLPCNVVDKEAPVLNLKGKKDIVLCPNQKYEEEGYEVSDNYDKDLLEKVEKKELENRIDYIVNDSSGNKALASRNIKYEDKSFPVITLKGSSIINVAKNSKYYDAGYTASDNCDGDLTNKVIVTGKVDTSKVGTYVLYFEVQDSTGNKTTNKRTVKVIETSNGGYSHIISGPTYINGILIVNKTYSIPSSFGGSNSTANLALSKLQSAAKSSGYSIPLVSGYRSYSNQQQVYNNWYAQDGAKADTYSARPGHSEHQTGLAFDVGKISDNYGNTAAGKWLKEHCADYGFIIRYPKGKESITGFKYEPWHIRYVGVEHAKNIMSRGITLEEYLGIA